jgi:hypothetical protein
MGLDRSLDEEGIPDLEGPLPGKVATGDPQEGTAPPSDRPASLDYGVTAEEQERGEPLERRVAHELPDEIRPDDESPVLVAPEDDDDVPGDPDDEQDLVARDAGGDDALSAEEAAVHVVDEP